MRPSTRAAPAPSCQPEAEPVVAALLEALCSPGLYVITMRDGELFIEANLRLRPRPARGNGLAS